MLFKRNEVVVDEHCEGQRGPDERLSWCETGWALVLRDTVVDECLLDCSEISVKQTAFGALFDEVGMVPNDRGIEIHFKVLMINKSPVNPYK